MNIQTVRDNLLNTIAGKEKYLAECNNTELTATADRIHRATIVGMLELNINELQRILQDVEQCIPYREADAGVYGPEYQGQ
jgi:hypothetical protein